MNKRNLVLNKYGISGKRYKELCGFCEQYPEWIAELNYGSYGVTSKVITDMPLPPQNNSDKTSNLAIKRTELDQKCKLVQETAKQANEDLWEYIIKSVCYEVPLAYLISVENMPCSRSAFYDARRYFFYLLDQNKKM